MLYTLADAAVAVDAGTTSASDTAATAQKSGGWFGFISDAMEVVLKVNGYFGSFVFVLDMESGGSEFRGSFVLYNEFDGLL